MSTSWEMAALEQFLKDLPGRARRLRNKPREEAKRLALEYSLQLKRLLDAIASD